MNIAVPGARVQSGAVCAHGRWMAAVDAAGDLS